MSRSNAYSIDTCINPDLNRLKSSWQELETRNNGLSFFHSWAWIQTWIQVYQPEILLVSAKDASQTVALGLFVKHHETRHGIIKSKQIRLLQTGKQEEDQIWVEFNGFLCHPDHAAQASIACLRALLAKPSLCDEIVISMMPKSQAEDLLRHFNNTCICLSTPTYNIRLSSLLPGHKSYLETLSRNTRYQINRSKKKYEELFGPLRLTFANSWQQALEYWNGAKDLHTHKWHDSGFHNPAFVSFHETFIKNHFDEGLVDIVKITAGDHLIAIIYNILYRKNVYFYLQGIQYDADSKLKPGLTAHSMLIEHYLHEGMKTYDFMGGHSQYKQQLAKAVDEQIILKIQKPHFRFHLENIARDIKQKFF